LKPLIKKEVLEMRTKYKKKIKNGKEYFFYRLRHKNLEAPKDIYAKTVKELNEKIKKITNLLDQEIDANNETFGEFFDWWIENIKIPKIKPQTKENTLNRYKRIKKYSICKIKLKDLKIKNIQDFYNKLSNEDIKYSTIKRIESLINQAFKYAYNQRYIEREFKGAYTIKKEKEVKEQKIKVYSIEEQKKLEKIIKGNKHEMLYITLLYTGIRLGEALALKWEDINFEEDPEFSRGFILRGKKEKEVREFFNSRVRSAFVKRALNGYKYEGIENCFVVSVSGKMNIDDRLKLLSNAMNVLREIVPEEQEEYLS